MGGGHDLVVAIPSYNCAHTVNYVVYQAARGLAEYFPESTPLILVSDGGSVDGTREVVRAMKLPFDVDVVVEEYPGIGGKGSAIRHAFARALEEGARAVVMLDSDLRSVTPEWVKLLGAPYRGDYDLVAPLYARHKFDGTITKHLAYPLTRALYGVDLRQPIGGDFGLSARLVEELLESPLWENECISRFGIDVFITNTALAKGRRVAQAELGVKLHDPKDPAVHLESMFIEVSGAQMLVALENEESWLSARGLHGVPILKAGTTWRGVQPVEVDPERALEKARVAVGERAGALKRILGDELYESIASFLEGTSRTLGDEEWAEAVYLHMLAFRERSGERGILEALHACWLAKVASYIAEVSGASEEEAEEVVEREARAFEEKKEFLVERWIG